MSIGYYSNEKVKNLQISHTDSLGFSHNHRSVEHVYLQDELPSKLRYLSFFSTGKKMMMGVRGSPRVGLRTVTPFFVVDMFGHPVSLFLCEDPQEESMKDPRICTD